MKTLTVIELRNPSPEEAYIATHVKLEELGYDTSDLYLPECLDIEDRTKDYVCRWRDLVILVSRDWKRIEILRK